MYPALRLNLRLSSLALALALALTQAAICLAGPIDQREDELDQPWLAKYETYATVTHFSLFKASISIPDEAAGQRKSARVDYVGRLSNVEHQILGAEYTQQLEPGNTEGLNRMGITVQTRPMRVESCEYRRQITSGPHRGQMASSMPTQVTFHVISPAQDELKRFHEEFMSQMRNRYFLRVKAGPPMTETARHYASIRGDAKTVYPNTYHYSEIEIIDLDSGRPLYGSIQEWFEKNLPKPTGQAASGSGPIDRGLDQGLAGGPIDSETDAAI